MPFQKNRMKQIDRRKDSKMEIYKHVGKKRSKMFHLRLLCTLEAADFSVTARILDLSKLFMRETTAKYPWK
jgi:hypothetical protein